MKYILICNQKSRGGKTMIADELASAFERDRIPINFYNWIPWEERYIGVRKLKTRLWTSLTRQGF